MNWIDAAKQLPDSDTTVLIHVPGDDEPVWLGFHDGEMWRYVDGMPIPGVTQWADIPTPQSFDLVAHLHRQRDFSLRTFGPGARAAGVVDHIVKELHEILDEPDDLNEWIDVVILAFDGAWRAGYTPEQIVAALVAKQTKNEQRKWPDWRTAEPGKAIEHIRDGDK